MKRLKDTLNKKKSKMLFKRLINPTSRNAALNAVKSRTMATRRAATPLGTFYKLVMKRTYTYMFLILFGTIAMENIGTVALDGIWRMANSGVSIFYCSIVAIELLNVQ
jgi:hypothetical protein